jgi:hypothetical protein
MLEAASPGLGYDIEMPEGQRLLSALQGRFPPAAIICTCIDPLSSTTVYHVGG